MPRKKNTRKVAKRKTPKSKNQGPDVSRKQGQNTTFQNRAISHLTNIDDETRAKIRNMLGNN